MERLGDRGYLLTPEEWGLIIENPGHEIYRQRRDAILVGNAGGLIERGEKHIMTVAALSSEARDEFEDLCVSVGVKIPPLNQSADVQSTSQRTAGQDIS